jgi:V8-like Glu-specific endopeptidase
LGMMNTLFMKKGSNMKRGQLNVSLAGASLLAIAAVLSACGSGTTDRSVRKVYGPNGLLTYVSSFVNPDQIEKIIGENDLTPVLEDGANIPEKYRSLIDAFGKISMGCSATHIGDGLVISAGHCFDAPERRGNNLSCDKITVDWGYRKDKPAYLKSKCVVVLAAELSDNRDYAIFKVDVAPEAKIELDLSERPKTGTPLTIFGHPQLRPLEWSKTCVLEEASKGGWGTDEFSHQCDTEPGNSGSTIIDDSSLKIIGIHDGGRVPWNYGTFITDTPIREFIGGGDTPTDPTPTDPTTPGQDPDQDDSVTQLPNQLFGPFKNNQNMVLTSFSADLGETISFDMLIDLENGRDFVTVEYGDGQKVELTGVTRKRFENIQLPVRVSFRSNAFIRSNDVILQNIKVYKAQVPNP